VSPKSPGAHDKHQPVAYRSQYVTGPP
jgi:hypothetical protein